MFSVDHVKAKMVSKVGIKEPRQTQAFDPGESA